MTAQYPFGVSESFLGAELPHLTKVFAAVHLVPTARGVAQMGSPRTLPPGVILRKDVIATLAQQRARPFYHHGSGLGQVLRVEPGPERMVLRELLADLAPAWGGIAATFSTNLRRLACFWGHANLVAAALRKTMRQCAPTALYSYWLNAAALGACLAFPDLPVVARAHGHDLYAYRHPAAYLPLQAALVRRLRAVLCISAHGEAYVHHRFTTDARKVLLCPLGVAPAPQRAYPSEDTTLRVFSCAHISAVKRLDRWIAALAQVPQPVHWTHVGDGPGRVALQQACAALPAHITVTWRGAVPAEAVVPLLTAGPADLFVNTSDHEGRPVSLMEALSVGLPARAPNVGGIPELLPPAWLWPDNPSPTAIAQGLMQVASTSAAQRQVEGDQAWALWQARANADTVYPAFVRQLQQALAEA